MKTVALLLGLLILLGLCGGVERAGAAEIDWSGADITSRPSVIHGLTVARGYWGRLPACANVRTFSDPNQTVAALGEQPGCTIWVNRSLLFVIGSGPQRRQVLCNVLVHEVGHLLGYGHGPASPADPLDAMNPDGASLRYCEPMNPGTRSVLQLR